MPAVVQGLFIRVKGTLIMALTYKLPDMDLNICLMEMKIFVYILITLRMTEYSYSKIEKYPMTGY